MSVASVNPQVEAPLSESSEGRSGADSLRGNGGVQGLSELIAQLDARSQEGPPSLADLQALFENLELDASDVTAFQFFDTKCYRRNRIRRTDNYEILLICWAPGQASPVHDHSGSACAFRVLEGRCNEQRFWPCCGLQERQLTATPCGASIEHEPGTVCVSFDADVHRVANLSAEENLCTLHLYAPPLDGMRTYESLEERMVSA